MSCVVAVVAGSVLVIAADVVIPPVARKIAEMQTMKMAVVQLAVQPLAEKLRDFLLVEKKIMTGQV